MGRLIDILSAVELPAPQGRQACIARVDYVCMGGSTDRVTHSIGLMINRSINQPNQSIDQPINQSNQSTNQSTDQPINHPPLAGRLRPVLLGDLPRDRRGPGAQDRAEVVARQEQGAAEGKKTHIPIDRSISGEGGGTVGAGDGSFFNWGGEKGGGGGGA